MIARRARTHERLGFASFVEYVERLFGYAPRWTQEKIRVAEALDGLPGLARALRYGDLSWSAMRELTRVATPETEADWAAWARGRTVRQLERGVAGRKPGDRPGAPSDPHAVRHVVRFEVLAETLATFRDAMVKLRRDAGEWLDDDAVLLAMARHVLGGPTEQGRSSYQVQLTVCDVCRKGEQQGAGDRLHVQPEIVEMARCDAQTIPPPAPTRPADSAADERASQSVPPAVRRRVMRRDGSRCVVPGCRHATFVDVHHLDLRSEGGSHDPDRLVIVCSAHHRAMHLGRLVVTGGVSTGLQFRHADGRPYGHGIDAGMSDAFGKAFRALRRLGFSEREVVRALDVVRGDGTHVGTRAGGSGIENAGIGAGVSSADAATHSTTVDSILRSALALLTAHMAA